MHILLFSQKIFKMLKKAQKCENDTGESEARKNESRVTPSPQGRPSRNPAGADRAEPDSIPPRGPLAGAGRVALHPDPSPRRGRPVAAQPWLLRQDSVRRKPFHDLTTSGPTGASASPAPPGARGTRTGGHSGSGPLRVRASRTQREMRAAVRGFSVSPASLQGAPFLPVRASGRRHSFLPPRSAPGTAGASRRRREPGARIRFTCARRSPLSVLQGRPARSPSVRHFFSLR